MCEAGVSAAVMSGEEVGFVAVENFMKQLGFRSYSLSKGFGCVMKVLWGSAIIMSLWVLVTLVIAPTIYLNIIFFMLLIFISNHSLNNI